MHKSVLLQQMTVTLTALLFWISFFLLTLVFGFPSNGKLWSSCCLSFHWLSNKLKTGCPTSSHDLWLFLSWLGWSSWLFERRSMGGYISVPLLLLVNFVSGFRLELMCICLIVSIRENPLISMVFSSLCCCHSSRKSFFSSVPTNITENFLSQG